MDTVPAYGDWRACTATPALYLGGVELRTDETADRELLIDKLDLFTNYTFTARARTKVRS